MVFGIIGENCSGKSTLAEKIKTEFGAEIITGKDYLRMAKSESEAVSLFREKLRRAVSGENIIYVIADPEHVKLLPDGAVRILVTADLETIKERFTARMHGTLPKSVALMLERRHGIFDTGEYDYHFDGAAGDADAFCEVLKSDKSNGENSFTIRRLSEDERQAALELAWRVFSEYESPDYAPEGTEEFRKCIHDEGYLSGLHYYGAFDEGKLVGEIAIRPEIKHICFFFVDGRYHRRGIGTRMFRHLLEDYPNETITLNSSPYGLPFYKAIGFVPTDEEKTVNGIRFTQMKYEGKGGAAVMNKKALVVIDIQNDITKHYKDIIDNINAAIDWAVDLGMTVIYIKHNNLSPGTRTFKPDTKGAELAPELKVVSNQIFVKTKANSLTGRDFSEYIQRNGIDEFYITGADATACVKSTCFNMTKAGYTVHVISDCVTSYDLKKIPELLTYYADKGCEVKTLAEYQKDL